MKKWFLCAAAAVGLTALICFPHLSTFAENEDNGADLQEQEGDLGGEDKGNGGIFIYELGDPRVPDTFESDGVIHDLNKSAEEEGG